MGVLPLVANLRSRLANVVKWAVRPFLPLTDEEFGRELADLDEKIANIKEKLDQSDILERKVGSVFAWIIIGTGMFVAVGTWRDYSLAKRSPSRTVERSLVSSFMLFLIDKSFSHLNVKMSLTLLVAEWMILVFFLLIL